MGEQLLAINDLEVRYVLRSSTVEAVNGITLHVDKGESVGLVGETGAGKTTTALSIMGLVPNPPGKVTKGEILFNGEDLLKKDDKAMRGIRGANSSTTTLTTSRRCSAPRRCWSWWESPATATTSIRTSSLAA